MNCRIGPARFRFGKDPLNSTDLGGTTSTLETVISYSRYSTDCKLSVLQQDTVRSSSNIRRLHPGEVRRVPLYSYPDDHCFSISEVFL